MKKNKLMLGAAATMAGALGFLAFTNHSQKRGQGTAWTSVNGTCTLVDCATSNFQLGKCDNTITYYGSQADCQNEVNPIQQPLFATPS